MKSRILLAAMILGLTPVSASDVDEPIGDCSDWTIEMPGVTCTEVMEYPCDDGQGGVKTPCLSGNASAGDIQGGIFATNVTTGGVLGFEPNCAAGRTEIVVFKDGIQQTVAYSEGGCDLVSGILTERRVLSTGLTLDAVNGALYYALGSLCYCGSSCDSATACPYPSSLSPGGPARLLKFDGFTTLFEVQQTYESEPLEWTIKVPLKPEGFDRADYFDAYYGALTHPIDFTQAEGLQCGFPMASPSPGDALSIIDAVPNPPVGQGYYYVSAATYQGQTRYGRQLIDGALSGRDPELLPSCWRR